MSDWFAGRYELQSPLGRGGMATVYRAWDHHTQRTCAVKILSEALSEDEQFRQRFRQEATAARGLTHPRIVRVDDWGAAGSHHFIVMEYVAGGSLRDLLRRRERLPQPLALDLAADVADALAHAHARGVVHRDIKPENLLLDEEGRIKVADFGIARTVDAATLTRTGIVMGSARYLSPEQARGEPAGPRSDLYALGVVLFEMLVGRVPFDAESAVAIAVQHVHEPPPRIEQLRPDVDAPVAAAVERLLAKREEDRYPTAGALAETLRRHASEPADTVRLDLRSPSQAAILPTAPLTVDGATAALTATGPFAEPAASVGRPDSPGVERPGRPAVPRPERPAVTRRPKDLRPAAVLAVVVALAIAIGSQGYRLGRPRVAVPSFAGQPVAAASQTAQTLGLRLVVAARRQDARIPAGAIIAQDHRAGELVGTDSVVAVEVSQGSGIVPDLRGLPFDDAARRLVEAAGLRLRRLDLIGAGQADDLGAGATIVAQAQAPGTHLPPDSTVDVMLVRPPKTGPETPAPPAVPGPEAPASPAVPAPGVDRGDGREKN